MGVELSRLRNTGVTLVAMAAATLGGCFQAPPFSCSNDDVCVRGQKGICIKSSGATSGFCAFADEACASGYRYDRTADALANQCTGGDSGDMAGLDGGVDATTGDMTHKEFVWSTEDQIQTSPKGRPVKVISGHGVYAVGADEFVGKYSGFDGRWGAALGSLNSQPTLDFERVWSLNDEYAVLIGEDTVVGIVKPNFSMVKNVANGVAVWGVAVDDFFAVGDAGSIVHYVGSSSTSGTIGTKNLKDIWGSSASDIYIVGDGGTILHSTSSGFLPQDVGTTANFISVHGCGPRDVYAISTEPGTTTMYINRIWHFKNGFWTPELSDAAVRGINDVYCIAPDEIYASGYGGIAKSNGDGVWTYPKNFFEIPKDKSTSIWQRSGGDLIVAWGDYKVLKGSR